MATSRKALCVKPPLVITLCVQWGGSSHILDPDRWVRCMSSLDIRSAAFVVSRVLMHQHISTSLGIDGCQTSDGNVIKGSYPPSCGATAVLSSCGIEGRISREVESDEIESGEIGLGERVRSNRIRRAAGGFKFIFDDFCVASPARSCRLDGFLEGVRVCGSSSSNSCLATVGTA